MKLDRSCRKSRGWMKAAAAAIAGLLFLVASILAVPLLFGPAPAAEQLAGNAWAKDGDSLILCPAEPTPDCGGPAVRIYGIDAFELEQQCRGPAGAEWACGRAARAFLIAILRVERRVECAVLDRDRYGRVVAQCRAGAGDLARMLLQAGLALAYRSYRHVNPTLMDGYIALELEARAARRGAWAGDFDPPEDWRRERGR
jgi:endonuclease YncB( thermonuclease family)